MNSRKLMALLACAFMVSACQPTIPDPEPDDTVYGSDAGGSDADTYGADDDAATRGGFLDDDSQDFADELANVIYFEFDSSEISPEYTDIVARHAIQLSDDQRLQVRLEGHADERGSREYNIGLGERRAQTVRRMLLLQGATPAQVNTVSFGEERPEAFGSDEASYARNRRVVFEYN